MEPGCTRRRKKIADRQAAGSRLVEFHELSNGHCGHAGHDRMIHPPNGDMALWALLLDLNAVRNCRKTCRRTDLEFKSRLVARVVVARKPRVRQVGFADRDGSAIK